LDSGTRYHACASSAAGSGNGPSSAAVILQDRNKAASRVPGRVAIEAVYRASESDPGEHLDAVAAA